MTALTTDYLLKVASAVFELKADRKEQQKYMSINVGGGCSGTWIRSMKDCPFINK